MISCIFGVETFVQQWAQSTLTRKISTINHNYCASAYMQTKSRVYPSSPTFKQYEFLFEVNKIFQIDVLHEHAVYMIHVWSNRQTPLYQGTEPEKRFKIGCKATLTFLQHPTQQFSLLRELSLLGSSSPCAACVPHPLPCPFQTARDNRGRKDFTMERFGRSSTRQRSFGVGTHSTPWNLKRSTGQAQTEGYLTGLDNKATVFWYRYTQYPLGTSRHPSVKLKPTDTSLAIHARRNEAGSLTCVEHHSRVLSQNAGRQPRKYA